MTKSPMMKVVGIILIVIGAGLLVWGFQMADSVGNQVAETVTGSATDAVMQRYIGGAASLAVGLYLFFRKS